MTPSGDAGTLRDRIAAEIRARGPMTFARFMDLALNDPQAGYYAAGPGRLGPRGDFFTASDLGDAFGACLARQIEEMDRALGGPDPFTYVELGAGRGLLARDVRAGLEASAPGLARRMRFRLVDRSPAMRRAAAEAVPGADVTAEAGPATFDGCVVAVELFDALPVHRVRRRGAELAEVYVGLSPEGALVETEGPPTPDAAAWARRWGAAPEDGDEAEACPAALEVVDGIAASLRRGFACVVDYGYPAAELHDRSHARGTALAYRRHAVSESLLDDPGEQDLTAHVNFSALEDRARERGMRALGLTTQDRFLVSLGLLERFEAADEASWRDPARVRARMQALALLHPHGMGRAFKVLLLAKGIDPPPLAGLSDPFAR